MTNYFYNALVVGAIVTILVCLWRPNWLRRFFAYILRDEMPIWLSVALAAAAAVGAYLLAPLINQDLENQKNRSAHIISTLNNTNRDIIDLSVSVRKFNDSLFYQKKSLSESKDDALDKITELQWKLIDIGVIIDRSGRDRACVDTLGSALESLEDSVVEATKPEDQEVVIEKYGDAAEVAKSCLDVLYSAANIK